MFGILLFLLCLFIPPRVYAINDPLAVPNNKYGIHIVDTNDMPDIPPLLNSTGGDWGYVTMVLSDGDRNKGNWQKIFDDMRRKHLIPIIRLATHVESSSWAKPNRDRFYEIVDLLNGLNWPTENRYVILYNEPNHANEWGGTLDPEGYAEDLVTFATALKKANENFFILPAGLDASAADDGIAMDEAVYLQRMITAKPDILTIIDGWTSHAYPNPGFSGSPYARGRGTLTTFDWELSQLKQMGLTKNLPVFITETGWEHSEGKTYASGLLSADQVGANILIAAANVWSDPRIAAVTPFLLNYQDVPFDHFSWRKMESHEFYPQYSIYQNIPKIQGKPIQHELYSLLSPILPPKLISDSTYTLKGTIENDGQGILSQSDGYALTVTSNGSNVDASVDPLPVLEPGDKGNVTVHIKTPSQAGRFPVTLSIMHNDRQFLLQQQDINLVPPPSIQIHAVLGWKHTSNADNVSVLIYEDKTLLQKFSGLTMKDGIVSANELANIVPGQPYRVVILVPGYLPRQVIGALSTNVTNIYPSRMLPLDFSGDGAFTSVDLTLLLRTSPFSALVRFFGP